MHGLPLRETPGTEELPSTWQPILDRASGAIFYYNATTGVTQWNWPGSEPAAKLHQLQRPLLPEPYPQVIETPDEPDLLAVSYLQVPDDSKPDVADHQFVSPEATVLQAPSPHP